MARKQTPAKQIDEGAIALTPKQLAFVTAYLGAANFNATEAARLAGYGGSDAALAVCGHENLRKPKISALVNQAYIERGMEPDEIIGRLSDMARGSLSDFFTMDEETGEWTLDIKKAKLAGKMHLLKKYKYGKFGVEIELHNPLDALDKLARIRLMFGEQQIAIDVRILNVIMESLPIEERQAFADAIKAATEI